MEPLCVPCGEKLQVPERSEAESGGGRPSYKNKIKLCRRDADNGAAWTGNELLLVFPLCMM